MAVLRGKGDRTSVKLAGVLKAPHLVRLAGVLRAPRLVGFSGVFKAPLLVGLSGVFKAPLLVGLAGVVRAPHLVGLVGVLKGKGDRISRRLAEKESGGATRFFYWLAYARGYAACF